jgi:hypothetical protein
MAQTIGGKCQALEPSWTVAGGAGVLVSVECGARRF